MTAPEQVQSPRILYIERAPRPGYDSPSDGFERVFHETCEALEERYTLRTARGLSTLTLCDVDDGTPYDALITHVPYDKNVMRSCDPKSSEFYQELYARGLELVAFARPMAAHLIIYTGADNVPELRTLFEHLTPNVVWKTNKTGEDIAKLVQTLDGLLGRPH